MKSKENRNKYSYALVMLYYTLGIFVGAWITYKLSDPDYWWAIPITAIVVYLVVMGVREYGYKQREKGVSSENKN